MRSATWCTLAGLLVLGLAAAPVTANGIPFPPPGKQPTPPPPPRPQAFAPLVVVTDDNVKEARLEIPRKLLRNLRVDLGEEQEPDTRRALAPLPRLHTLLAGVALSLALVTGGLWLTRSRNRLAGRGLMLLLVAGGLLIVGSGVLWADIGVRPNPFGPRPGFNPFQPPNMKQPPAVFVPPPGALNLVDKVGIVVVDKGDAITLVVNRDDLVRVVEKSAPDKDKPGQPPPGGNPVVPPPGANPPRRPGLPPG
jgi:hypothetical protein